MPTDAPLRLPTAHHGRAAMQFRVLYNVQRRMAMVAWLGLGAVYPTRLALCTGVESKEPATWPRKRQSSGKAMDIHLNRKVIGRSAVMAERGAELHMAVHRQTGREAAPRSSKAASRIRAVIDILVKF